MGKLMRALVIALGVVAMLLSGAPGAVAGNDDEVFHTGKRCVEDDYGIKRCALIWQYDPTHRPRFRKFGSQATVAKASDQTEDEQQVRIRLVMFQRRTADGWKTVAREKMRHGWKDTSDTAIMDQRRCRRTANATYRTRAKTQWRNSELPDAIQRAWINSVPLRKREFC